MGLPIVLLPTCTIGIFNGMRVGLNRRDPIDSFCQIIGYSSLGLITGIIYPISLPVLAGYVLIQNREIE